MLSDKAPHLSKRKARSKTAVKQWYSDGQKLEAVKLWLVCGNLRQTAAALEVPIDTLKAWRYSKWWDELCLEMRAEGSIKLSNRLKSIVTKSLDLVEDRLDNGDFVLNQKTGEIIRKPVPLVVVANVTTALMDRQLKLEDRPSDDASKMQVKDRLLELADAFAKFANRNKPTETIDVEFKELVE